MAPSKTLLLVVISAPQAEGNYPFPQAAFFENLFSPSRKERGGGETSRAELVFYCDII